MSKQKSEKRLREIVAALPENHIASLMDFGEYLFQKYGVEQHETEIMEPLQIARPEEESVIAAIKRLSATYPMIDKDALFNQTSSLMMQHMLQGREAGEVIDEAEQLFADHYQKLLESREEG